MAQCLKRKRNEEEEEEGTVKKRHCLESTRTTTTTNSDVRLLKDLKETLGEERHVNVYKVDSFIQRWFNKKHYQKTDADDDKQRRSLFDRLRNDVRYKRDVFKIYGKETLAPRLTASFGNPGTNYRFSGSSHPSLPLSDPNSPYYDTFLKEKEEKEKDEDEDERKKYWPSFLYALVTFLETWMVEHFLPVMKKHSPYWKDVVLFQQQQEEKIRFDYVLINRYETGKEYIGYHADSESDLKKHGIIVSISLGATRDFCFQPIINVDNDSKKKKTTFKYALNDGDMVIMTDDTQKYTKHAVPKRTTCKDERINLTFRQMK